VNHTSDKAAVVKVPPEMLGRPIRRIEFPPTALPRASLSTLYDAPGRTCQTSAADRLGGSERTSSSASPWRCSSSTQWGEGGVSFDDALLLIEPEAAKNYAIEQQELIDVTEPGPNKHGVSHPTTEEGSEDAAPGKKSAGAGPPQPAKVKSFRGSVDVNPTLAKSRLNAIADEVIALLGSDPNATIRITLEIDAEFPNGATDTIKCGVSENATSLKFKTKNWE
jgi:hypothetical protein